MGHQTDITLFFAGLKIGKTTTVQRFQHLRIAMVFTNTVQQIQKDSVILPVYGLKLDSAIFRLLQSQAGEEIRSIVILLQHLPLLLLHYGSQLLQIADHQQLHATKRLLVIAVTAKHLIHRIQQVGTYHADLIDHQQVHAAYYIDFLFAETETVGSIRTERTFGHIRRKGNLKE